MALSASDATVSPRPVIGLTTYLQQAQTGVWDVHASFLPDTYLQGVVGAGGIATLLPPQPVDAGIAARVLDGIDGLIKALLHSVVAAKQGTQTEVPETLETALVALCNIVDRNFHPSYYSRDNLLVWLPIFELAIHDVEMRTGVMQRDEEDVREMESVLGIICTLRGKTALPAEVAKLFFALLDGLWLRWCYSGRPDYAEEKTLAIGLLEDHIGPFYGAHS